MHAHYDKHERPAIALARIRSAASGKTMIVWERLIPTEYAVLPDGERPEGTGWQRKWQVTKDRRN